MRAFLTLFIITLALFASESSYAIKKEILEKVFKNISINKEIIIWSDNKNLQNEFEKSKTFRAVQNCQDATLIIVEDKKNFSSLHCNDKAIFVLDYELLKDIPQSFGAMFWKKARPNIVIISPRAKNQNISISQTLNPYIEENVW